MRSYIKVLLGKSIFTILGIRILHIRKKTRRRGLIVEVIFYFDVVSVVSKYPVLVSQYP